MLRLYTCTGAVLFSFGTSTVSRGALSFSKVHWIKDSKSLAATNDGSYCSVKSINVGGSPTPVANDRRTRCNACSISSQLWLL